MKGGELSEQFVSGEEVFRGRFLRLHRDVARLPDGTQAVREYVRHPGAVAIVALTEEGRVILERQHRYPLGRDFVEIPAGKLEPDEVHFETAKLDDGEFLEVFTLPFEDALAIAADGRITDVKTIIGLFRANRRSSSSLPPAA